MYQHRFFYKVLNNGAIKTRKGTYTARQTFDDYIDLYLNNKFVASMKMWK